MWLLCRHHTRYTMAEWMSFVDVYSPYILMNLPWSAKGSGKEVKRMFVEQWAALRPGVLFTLRYHHGQHTAERLQQAENCFKQYALLVQQVESPPIALMSGRLIYNLSTFVPASM